MPDAFFLGIADWATKSTLILVFGFWASSCLKRNSELRRAVWVSCFVCVAALLFCSLLFPARWALGPSVSSIESFDTGFLRMVSHEDHLVQWLVLAWFIGFIAVSIYTIVCCVVLWRLRKTSSPISFPPMFEQEFARRPVEVRISESAHPKVAMTWGLWRPVILLPKGARSWKDEQSRAILLHELAHVKRADSLVLGFMLVVCAAQWFHPLIWLAVRRFRADSELVADEAVINAGIQPSAYAQMLLAMAVETQAGYPLSSAFLTGSTLVYRVQSILDPKPNSISHRRQVAILGAIAFILVSSLSAVKYFKEPAHGIPQVFSNMSDEWKAGYQAGWRSSRSGLTADSDSSPPTAATKAEIERKLIARQSR